MKKFFSTPFPYVIAILIIIVIGYFLSIGRTKRLTNNHIVVCGKVLDMSSGRGGAVVTYEFFLNKKRYEFKTSSPKITYENYKRGIHGILILMEKDNPNLQIILSDPDDYDKFEVSVSDTANIVCN